MALRGVYPGIDLVFYGNARQLEYDWVVAPGSRSQADPREVGNRPEQGFEWDLILSGGLRQKKPAILHHLAARLAA